MVGEGQPHAQTSHRQSSIWWLAALFFVLGGSLLTEVTPVLLGSGAEAKVDWAFPYVTMKFVLLPGVSLLVLGAILRNALWRSHVPWQAWVAALTAIAYIIGIALWPVPWIS